MNSSDSNSDYGHDDFDKLKPILGKTASRTKELKDLRTKLSEYKQLYREEHAEREKLIEALEQLIVWAEAFEALPPDDMKDVFPFSQYTTAGDCRQLKVALGQARD